MVLAAAADTLGRFRSEGARTAIVAAFEAAKGTERVVAAHALRTVRGADVDAALVDAVAKAPPTFAPGGRRPRTQPGRSGASSALVAALGADAPSLRAAAARALGALGDRAAVVPLFARLSPRRAASAAT